MDFSLTSEQSAMRAAVHRYCADQCGFEARRDRTASRDGDAVAAQSRLHWQAFANMGWLGAALPPDVGGSGGSVLESAILFEELGRAIVREPLLPCIALAAQVIDKGGTAEQREKLLQPLVRGELLVALMHAEARAANGGRDSITAERCDATATYTLTGHKSVVPGGADVSLLLVSVPWPETPDLDGANGEARRNIFIVDAQADGVIRRDFPTLDGMRASEIVLRNVRVDESSLLGEWGQAGEALRYATEHAMLASCAEMVGAMDGLLWLTRDYLRQRRQYGVALSSLQALQHQLADLFAELELSRSMLYRGLSAFVGEEKATRSAAVAAAKTYIGRSGRRLGEAAIQLHGGMGMADEYKAGHYFKRLLTLAVLLGGLEPHQQ
ncbi:acyl-CoA dehydrogenase family protein [Dyella tabacisoli]|uniref:Acyl-CoA dehydrogenase n=1 Tax=Dyella tabacisoli TaxID=2282381 RepID=A0A369UJA0_9GAMM|nr:acyl-CoA dehydrogenase family protein [Dyella tabacisoli]RDD80423.1 acyl-CoA dehydrogenase [Dyella tabacisoli]